jgi:hypothetical protein
MMFGGFGGTRGVLRTREGGGDEHEDESRVHFEIKVKRKVKTVINFLFSFYLSKLL